MQSLKNFLDQILLIWRTSTPAARLGIGLLTLACVAIIAGVGYWSVQPNFVELASDLESGQMESLMTELDRQNMKYEVRGGGNMLWVDKRVYQRARMLAEKAGVNNDQFSELDSAGPWATPLDVEKRDQLNLERKLAYMIKRNKNIKSADVKLAIPRDHAFLRTTDPPTAAVKLEIKPGAKFTEEAASSIAAMVSASVTGMSKTDVTIVDSTGRQYNIDSEGLAAVNNQEEARNAREQALTKKAIDMLIPVTGMEHIVVNVAADLTFVDAEKKIFKVSPEDRVVVSEDVESQKDTDNTPKEELGAAGINNQLSGGSAAKKNSVLSTTENTKTTWVPSETMQIERDRTPKINSLTISVVVNSKLLEDTTNSAKPITKEQIESVVKNAVGFQEDRDFITVEFLPFLEITDDVVAAPTPIPWEQINEILRNVSLAVAAVVALFVGMMVMKKFKPGPVRGPMGLALSEDGVNRISQLTQLAEKNPEVFSKIISAWAKASETSGKTAGKSGPSAKAA